MSNKEQDRPSTTVEDIVWIPDDIIVHVMRNTADVNELKIIMAIGRRAWSAQKSFEIDQIEKIAEKTFTPEKEVEQHIENLKKRNILLEIDQGSGRQSQLIVNPNVESWVADDKKKPHLERIKWRA